MALTEKLKAIADAIRDKTGSTGLLSLDEMAEMIQYLGVTGDDTNTYILVDEAGNEVSAVLVDEEVSLTATPNDIRIGSTALTESGYTVGEKEIPAYHTNEGFKVVTNGSRFVLTMKEYDYTKLQAIVCSLNSNLTDSVAAQKVAINDSVFSVKSTIAESSITKNDDMTQIDFGIVNDSGATCILRYFMYKEIY